MQRTPPQKLSTPSSMDTDQNPADPGREILVYASELYQKLNSLTISDPNTAPGEYLFPDHPEDHGSTDPSGAASPRPPTTDEKNEIRAGQTTDLDNVRAVLPGGFIPDRRPFDESKPCLLYTSPSPRDS